MKLVFFLNSTLLFSKISHFNETIKLVGYILWIMSNIFYHVGIADIMLVKVKFGSNAAHILEEIIFFSCPVKWFFREITLFKSNCSINCNKNKLIPYEYTEKIIYLTCWVSTMFLLFFPLLLYHTQIWFSVNSVILQYKP